MIVLEKTRKAYDRMDVDYIGYIRTNKNVADELTKVTINGKFVDL